MIRDLQAGMGEVTIVMLSGAVIPYLPMIFIAFSTPAGGQQQGKRQEAGELFQGGEGVMIGKVICWMYSLILILTPRCIA